ncbi:MAG: phosphoenolpyruvate--protein phosphotransferase [Hyphomicrobiales bacterium]|nr:phosphoenolpyruvate--protein phosphotransferase [Hyphomicrobiales bacterium]
MPWRTSAPRVLIRQLREVMARPDDSQARLNRIVKLIAANMVAEVSSIYVCHGDGSLELFATEGLRQEAVHKTRLARSEGLVGLIAERGQPISLRHAQSHPAFSYKPETGEESYRSFLGVPILRGGRALGVLTVQNAIEREYEQDEVEALQTTAMVLAEVLASGAMLNGALGPDPKRALSQTVEGATLSDGIALGHVVFHEPRIAITRLVSDDPARETARLEEALGELKQSLDGLLTHAELSRAGAHRDILEAYRMFANDQGWAKRLKESIAAGLTAEAAVERVHVDMRVKIAGGGPSSDRFLHDLDDLANRMQRILAGRSGTAASGELPKDAIVVARHMGAAELLDYDRERLRGVIIEDCGHSSHVAIVARALGVAAIGQTHGLFDMVEPNNPVVLDAEAGKLHIRPSLEVIKAFADKVRARSKRQAQYERLRDVPAVTQDKVRVSLLMNAGLTMDLQQFRDSGADGIGLYRTELQFMIASTYPTIAQQAQAYGAVLDAAEDRPVTFRALDVGGDKILPYLNHQHEENPALGWRAIRMSLDRPGLFRTQIRAMLKAARGRTLRVMAPFITDVAECRQAKALIEREMERLSKIGEPAPERVQFGAMIEVPSVVWQLPELLPLVDFISIGSNDLLQFFYAADRENPRVSARFDALSPASMRMLKTIVDQADAHGKPATVCGEMAGKPLEAMALVGLGFRSLSMAPASLGPVKAMLLSLNARHLAAALKTMVDAGEPELRRKLNEYCAANDVNIPRKDAVIAEAPAPREGEPSVSVH